MVIGTSTCHMLLADRHAIVEGVAGVVADGIIEGYYGYEAGQAAVGDLFGWYARHVGGPGEDGGQVFAALEREAAAAGPGGHGVVALDWWNGNRSVLMNAELSGLLVGMTLATTRGDVYRSLVEATGFGTRRHPRRVRRRGRAGDRAHRGRRARRTQSAAAARSTPTSRSGPSGWRRRPMRRRPARPCSAPSRRANRPAAMPHSFRPRGTWRLSNRAASIRMPRHARTYNELYDEYLELHDHFGRGGSDMMARLVAAAAHSDADWNSGPSGQPRTATRGHRHRDELSRGARADRRRFLDRAPAKCTRSIGENGAGKSTLIRILSGEIDGYEGELQARHPADTVRLASRGHPARHRRDSAGTAARRRADRVRKRLPRAGAALARLA